MFGLFLLFWGLLLLLSLLTYDKGDPSLNHVVSGTVAIQNGAGLFGAYLSGLLVDVFGFAAFVWPLFFLAWGAGCVSTLITLPWWRWLGFFLLATCLLSLGTAWNLGLGDVRGGGMLGRILHVRGTELFSPAGSTLIWLFFLFISLEMSFGIPWLDLMRRISRFFREKAREHNVSWGSVGQTVVRALPRPDLSRLGKLPRPHLPLPLGGGVRRAGPDVRESVLEGDGDGAGTSSALIIDLDCLADKTAQDSSPVAASAPTSGPTFGPTSGPTSAPTSGPTGVSFVLSDDDAAEPNHAPKSPESPKSPGQAIEQQTDHVTEQPAAAAGTGLNFVFRDGPIAEQPHYAPDLDDEQDDEQAVLSPAPAPSVSPVTPVTPVVSGSVSPVTSPLSSVQVTDSEALEATRQAEADEPEASTDAFTDAFTEAFDDVVVFTPSWSAPLGQSGTHEPDSTAGAAPAPAPAPESEAVSMHDEPEGEDLSAFMALTEDAAPAVLEPSVGSSADFTPPVQAGAAPRPRRRARIPMPSLELLSVPVPVEGAPPSREVLAGKGARLMACLSDFSIQGELAAITPGPVISMFEIRPAPGVKVSRIANLSDDLAMTLKAMAVRIQAPVPGSDTVGVEIPNEARAVVNFRELLQDASFSASTSPLNMALGKDIGGHPFSTDLSRMPHMLVAGATGAGKSVCLNSILLSFLYKCTPDDVRILLVDPKRVEMAAYTDLPHLVHPVVTDVSMAKTALEWAVHEMEVRYDAMARMGVRNIAGFNAKLKEFGDEIPRGLEDMHHLPFLVIIIDELADLMMTAGKEIESHIVRLAQLARAAGIHLIVATQRPSVDVVTGLIKANFPCRISFQVTSKHDSRTILDTVGAEHLLGKGDMLFKPSGGKLQRLHGAFVSDEEVSAVVEYWKRQQAPSYEVDFSDWGTDDAGGRIAPGGAAGPDSDGEDALYAEVIAFVREQGKVSISLIQRRFRIGFNKAARFVEQMEHDGLILPGDRQNKARKVNRGD